MVFYVYGDRRNAHNRGLSITYAFKGIVYFGHLAKHL